MPKLIIDYSKTIMYKFVCNDLTVDQCYVGHTTNWRSRKNIHKSSCTNIKNPTHNRKIYKIMRECGGWDNWQMIEIEKYPCNDSNKATARERYWYDQLNSTMNFYKPCLTDEERNNYDVLCRSSQKKEYYIANKAHTVQRKKLNVFTCTCGSVVRVNDRKQHSNTKKHIDAIALIIIDV